MRLQIKSVIPDFILNFISEIRQAYTERKNAKRTPKEIFQDVYERGIWGRREGQHYCSGYGSVSKKIVDPYVKVISEYLKDYPKDKIVVDLGCGDMQVSRHLLAYCDKYIGVDIVPEIVEMNKNNYFGDNVTFECIDIIDEELPDGNICLLRQVLQHLSNSQILKIIPKLNKYDICFITEHLPSQKGNVVPNLDMVCGGGTRLQRNSGVYLDKPPFNIHGLTVVLEVNVAQDDSKGILRTYMMKGGKSLIAS